MSRFEVIHDPIWTKLGTEKLFIFLNIQDGRRRVQDVRLWQDEQMSPFEAAILDLKKIDKFLRRIAFRVKQYLHAKFRPNCIMGQCLVSNRDIEASYHFLTCINMPNFQCQVYDHTHQPPQPHHTLINTQPLHHTLPTKPLHHTISLTLSQHTISTTS